MKNKRIYLTGFMTSGKSTIGPILANVLGWDFYDLDKVIEEEEDRSIVDIFYEEGENYFRNIETETLRKLSGFDNVIISLGGGSLTQDENFRLIKDSGKLIYLKVAPEILYHRLKNKIDRPLFRDLVLSETTKDEFIERINELLRSRANFYEKADLIINTDRTPLGITIDDLAKKVKGIIYEKN